MTHAESDSHAELEYRVMVVDDDVELLSTLSTMVTSWGGQVLSFNRFQDARAKLLAGVDADALLVDVRIGPYNGLHLVHLALKFYPTMTVVAMTGFDDPVLRAEAEKAGATFFVKPVPADALHKTLFGDAS